MRSVASVIANSRHECMVAEDKITSAAGFATSTMSSVPSHTDPLAWFPLTHARTYRVDDPGNLMSRHTRILNSRPQTILGKNIAVTDPAGLHLNQNMSHRGTG